ncbi:MAG: transporter substrate-binding domain-containing protein, partial [Eubacterium sp.]|nr:transporter substrate-binding domain-containing protein [Eubacterium sp.]
MRKKQWVIYISAVFVFLFLCFGRVNLSQAAGKSKTVRVPYGYNDFLKIDKDGEVSGYYAEYLNELARINHWKYEYVKATWPDAVRMLEEGKVDLLYPTNYSKERERTMDYPSLPVGYISVGVYALEGSNYKYDDYTSFDGARITYSKDSSNDEKLKTFAKEHGFSYHSVNRDTNYDMEQALKDGEADLAVFNVAVFNVADNFEGGVLVSVMEADPVYLTVRKGNKELLSEINSGMQNIMKKKSELAEAALRMTLTGKNDSLFALSDEERKFVDSGEEITVGF